MKLNFKIIFKTALWYTYSSILSKYGKKRQQLGMKSHFCCLWWWRFCIQGIWATMNVFMWFMSYFERLTLIIFTQTCFKKGRCNFDVFMTMENDFYHYRLRNKTLELISSIILKKASFCIVAWQNKLKVLRKLKNSVFQFH